MSRKHSLGVYGQGVTRFKVGDRVAGTFFEEWIDGAPSEASLDTDRGGNAGGMLAEVVVTHEDGLVSIPEHLSYEEAATLPCAAVTAWVSVFGLMFANALGAKPIITSSRDHKLARAMEMGATGTANYRSNPDWQLEVKKISGGHGSEVQTNDIMWINATVSGVYVGSRADFEAMNAFIAEHEIRPLIDRVFEFEDAPAAYEHMASGDFMGKIVIRH